MSDRQEVSTTSPPPLPITPVNGPNASWAAILAKCSWIAFLVVVGVNFAVGMAGGIRLLRALADLLGLLVAVSGIVCGIASLCGLPRYGRRGILIPACIGILLNGLILAIWIPNFLEARQHARERRSQVTAGGPDTPSPSSDSPVLRIAVLKSGEIRADGKLVSLQAMDGLLARNAQQNGVVWYYRETGREDPPPEAMAVIQQIVKYSRPLKMSSRPDFSDAVDANGKSVPQGR